MKKLVIAIIIFAIFTSLAGCKGKTGSSTPDSGDAKSPKTSAKLVNQVDCNYSSTLNGVDSGEAVHKINYFDNNRPNDKNQGKAASIWFNLDQIKYMDALLTAESDSSIPEAKRADGVRFYFAADSLNPGSNKLNLAIYLVTTRPQKTNNDPKKSAHGDYYCHSQKFSSAGGFGEPSNTNNIPGWGLYGVPVSGSPCNNEPSNYVDDDIAYSWVTLSRYAKPDPINTCSEWFHICFIQYLFETIIDNSKRLGGLRVYLALGDNANDQTKKRDIFLLVPTDNKRHDYYGCFADLKELPRSCQLDTDSNSWVNSVTKVYSNFNRNHNIMPRKLTKHEKFPFMYNAINSGGYDKGELCPDKCN